MAKPHDDTTASMQAFGAHAAPDARGGTRAGLVRLHASEEAGVAAVHLFERRESVVGRDPGCELVVAESATSRRHARFAFVDGRWTVDDLGSRNGTLVDGAFVGPGPVDLEDGNEIRVGDAVFKFVAAGAERYARHAASEGTKSLIGMVGDRA